ncbi:MAG: zraR 9 [Anaeromyxobacteraceae bacterium]|nr:zraR 9 [Anaeromyxobacteraceae bacterium]
MDPGPRDPSTPLIEPARPEPDLLVCLAAIGRALEVEFDPRAFLDELSTVLGPLVPHERLSIGYLANDRRTVSIFAEHGPSLFLPETDRYTTDRERPVRLPVAGLPVVDVYDGTVLCAADVVTDPRFAAYRDQLQTGALRSAIFVPLRVGTRIIGALGALSRLADAYGPVHVERMRTLGRLIGPFIEPIAQLYRERRQQHRIGRLKGITHALAASLDLRETLGTVGDAVRPALDFDTMGVILFTPGGPEYALFGTVGEAPVSGVERIPTDQFSYVAAVMAGRPVLLQDASKELDPAWAGDRAMLASGLQTLMCIPLSFGDEVGGALMFGKHAPYWYDDVDVEVATVVASQIVLGIQHQRLAEEQRRRAAVERRAQTLEHSLKSARTQLHARYDFSQILGEAPVLREALARAAQVAPTESTVLVTGESGTGKELVARAIHHASARADGPFVAVNCAALPDTLLESELFGHERGAFTGADRQKPGRFELAAGGTLFLDEIGDLSAAVQVKLLRVLQEREYQRVGGTATLKADVRLLTATNRDLTAEMAAGRFRSDLFYRLSVFNVHLPPLRERGDDVLRLADHFIRTLGPQMGKGDLTLSRDACDLLRRHPWPGNIRELQNAIERSLITSEGTLITAAHLALHPRPAPPPPAAAPRPAAPGSPPSSLEDLERQAVLDALQRAHGHKSRAAALLGLTRFQLYTRLKRYRIEVTPD